MSATWRDDKFHDECGLFGIWNHPEAGNVTYLGLYALQHRGQESAGIAATDGASFHTEKAMGWVADVFSPERLRRLPGRHRAAPELLREHGSSREARRQRDRERHELGIGRARREIDVERIGVHDPEVAVAEHPVDAQAVVGEFARPRE